MADIMITKGMREVIREHLGYDILRPVTDDRWFFDGAKRDGEIGINGFESESTAGRLFLNSNGKISSHIWCKTEERYDKKGIAYSGYKKDPDCVDFPIKQIASVPSEKAKILIAALFPEEVPDKNFKKAHAKEIKTLRAKLGLL